MNKLLFLIYIILAVGVFWFIRYLVISYNFDILNNFNYLLGINLSSSWLWIFYLSGFLLFGLVYFYYKQYYHKNKFPYELILKSGLFLIVIGGVSNFLERIVYGYVVDYIFIGDAVFNIADFSIILGVILLFYFEIKKTKG